MCDDWRYMAIFGLVQLVMSMIELWLGKTDKVKSSSIIELIYNLIKILITKPVGK
jgi:hypothetical protein